MNGVTSDPYVVVRATPLRDLVALARDAADKLRDRGADAQDLALADALTGATAEIVTDMAEPVLR